MNFLAITSQEKRRGNKTKKEVEKNGAELWDVLTNPNSLQNNTGRGKYSKENCGNRKVFTSVICPRQAVK